MPDDTLSFETSSDNDIVTGRNKPIEIVVGAQVPKNPENTPPYRVNETAGPSLSKSRPLTEDLELIKTIKNSISESELISGIDETTKIENKIHVMATIHLVPLDTLTDNSSSRVLIRKSV